MSSNTASQDLFSLSGKVAIITGSSRGIGFAIAKQLCSAGASCIINSENKEEVESAVTELTGAGFSCAGFCCDVTNKKSLASLIDFAIEKFSGLHILICNAGITGKAGALTNSDDADYSKVFEVNLHSMVNLTNLAIPKLKENGGSIILISSIASVRGNAMINAYAFAKAGVNQLARNLAVQFGPDNIRANSISPGLINTELSIPLMQNKSFMQHRLLMTPLRRLGSAEEIAGTAHFLASDAGAFVTGQNLIVDGGTTITDGS